MIAEKFNREHKEKYIAMISDYKLEDGKETLNLNSNGAFVREATSHDADELVMDKYIIDEDEPGSNVKRKFILLPAMKEKQRQCIYNTGQAGKGKTYLVNDYVQIYKLLNPKNTVFFFTLNNPSHDTSLMHKLYKFMDMQRFCNNLKQIAINLNEIQQLGLCFKNSLLVFDDIGNVKNNKSNQKAIWDFINQSAENFRKHDVSVIVIGHSSRLGHVGTIIKEELTHYIITGSALQTVNDVILKTQFNWKDRQIERLFNREEEHEKSRWIVIDTDKRIIIKEKTISLASYYLNEN